MIVVGDEGRRKKAAGTDGLIYSDREVTERFGCKSSSDVS